MSYLYIYIHIAYILNSKSSLPLSLPLYNFFHLRNHNMAAKLLSTGFRHSTLPENYVRPLSDRPRLSQVSQLEDFPLIDISSTDRSRLVQKIHQACARFGFFQVPIYTYYTRFDKVYELLNQLKNKYTDFHYYYLVTYIKRSKQKKTFFLH